MFERTFRRGLPLLVAVSAIPVAVHSVIALYARHELTQVESIVAMQSLMLSRGEGLYYSLRDYPFTVSPYGPIFYSLCAGLMRLGIPPLLAGRLISLASLTGIVVVSWRLLRIHTSGKYAALIGALLIVSTVRLACWGVVGQVDTLAVLLSVAALYCYSLFRACGSARFLALSGLLLVLAFFTKQTMVAAAATIILVLWLENWRASLRLALGVGTSIAVLALALNWITGGGYFENAVFSNLNPMKLSKVLNQGRQFVIVAGPLLIIGAVGVRLAFRSVIHVFYVYALFSVAVFLLTAAKVGSDLNYQIEPGVALGLCAGWALDRLEFFPKWFAAREEGLLLLEVALLLHILSQSLLGVKFGYSRWSDELARRNEVSALAPYFAKCRGWVLSVQIDPLLKFNRPLRVEPLIYTLLVDAGRINPEPVRRDLAERKFRLLVLFEDLSASAGREQDVEIPSLPKAQLDEVRKHYRLVARIPGPYVDGDFVYEPVAEGPSAQ